MAFVVLEIDAPALSIGNLNARVQTPTKPREAVELMRNLCDAILAGTVDASVQATTRDITASITTSGSGSTQQLYNLK